MGSSLKKVKKEKGPLPIPVHNAPKMNQQRVVYYQNQIRNMQLFCDGVGQQQAKITEQPFQVDILEVYHDRVYVVSSERQISIFDLITFDLVFGDRKIETSEQITQICFSGEKMFVGQKNKTLEVFAYTNMELVLKVNTRKDVTCLMTLENAGIVVGQEDGCVDILSPFYEKILVQEIHPFCDKITWFERTSRTGVCEIATVTAGQVYFTTIGMKASDD